MRDDRGLDHADLDRHITGNWGEDSVSREERRQELLRAGKAIIPLDIQAVLTANAMRNMANEMDKNSRDVPERYISAIRAHADDLERSAIGE